MSPAQTSLYWREWQRAKTTGRLDADERQTLHRQALGAPKSSKDFTNADLDKILATFRAISQPASLDGQLRQQAQPRARLEQRIRSQVKCLALFLHAPGRYLDTILHNRFKAGPWSERSARWSEAPAELSHNPSHRSDPSDPSDLSQLTEQDLAHLRSTLSRCLSAKRAAFNGALARGDKAAALGLPFHSPLQKVGQTLTEHNMCLLAKVDCFRRAEGCAQCRRAAPAADPDPAPAGEAGQSDRSDRSDNAPF